MNVSQAVARVYAQALIDLGEDSDCLPQIVDDLHAAQALYDDRTFREFFTSPRIEPAAKKKILNATLSDKLGRPVLGILNVLIDKGREMILDNVVDEFERFRDFREGRIHAYVTTARPLEEEQRKKLADRIARATDKEIAIHERIDPRILGGLIVKVGDKVLDGSIRRRLLGLKQALVAAKE